MLEKGLRRCEQGDHLGPVWVAEPLLNPVPLHLAQTHLLLIEETPFSFVGLISALIATASRTFIIPGGQAGYKQPQPDALPSPLTHLE